MISYAQNGDDVRLVRVLGHLPHGHYVEGGGFDPAVDSPTFALHDLGCDGLVVEPVPQMAESFRRTRPRDAVAQVVAGAHPRSAELLVFPESGLSVAVTGSSHSTG